MLETTESVVVLMPGLVWRCDIANEEDLVRLTPPFLAPQKKRTIAEEKTAWINKIYFCELYSAKAKTVLVVGGLRQLGGSFRAPRW